MRADAAGARRKSGGGGARARQQPAAATACDGPRGGDGRAVSVQPRRMRAAPHPHSARDRAIHVHEALVVVSFCGGSVAGSSPDIADGAPLMFAYKLCEISQYFHNSKPRCRSLSIFNSIASSSSTENAAPTAEKAGGSTVGRRSTSPRSLAARVHDPWNFVYREEGR